ncbi:excinuclease ABC subunit UvrC [Dokdonella fugitiva]|uniref:excinuclease ABC subunit UvrC n=1 Tax=Dokdonella fugitiva TaxID=328517 RepID=UPI0015FC850E|nr:excinuclease ABC subunit UvrC [Dokdonella fugitiva]MBA8883112.1 excinuclease ABC subunit C [Dokdonella fugitiva]
MSSVSAPPFDGKTFVRTLTGAPGVYRMFDADDELLYVGKAGNLKKRVGSYFLKPKLDPRIAAMVGQIARMETTVTRTEAEALLLEAQLIKSLKPRYNIVLRDDKSYPYIHLTADPTRAALDPGAPPSERFPRLAFHRGARSGKGRYFGPFPSAGAVRESLDLIQKLFRIRNCEDSYFRNRSRPCLQHQIGRCTAPCVGLVAPEDYAADVRHAEMFLDGRAGAVMDELVATMERLSADLAFERAAVVRDQIAAVKRVQARHYVQGASADMDVIACAIRGGIACVSVLFFRNGVNLGSRDFFPRLAGATDEAAILGSFIAQYYLERPVPAELIVSHAPDDAAPLAEALAGHAGHAVEIKASVRSDRARFLDLARRNADAALASRLASRQTLLNRFEALRDLLELDETPQRIECFDISHTMGEATVASCVVFGPEGPEKSQYRRFNITGITPGDDYAAMRQALQRRFRRESAAASAALAQEPSGDAGQGPPEAPPSTAPAKPPLMARLPDLLLIDGGKGQLQQAIDVLNELGLEGVPVVGVAKGEARRAGDETLIVGRSGRTLFPGPESPASHLVQAVRDEAHRFAITGHRGRREKAREASTLEEIAGVGARRRAALLKHFGGLGGLSKAGVEELMQVSGISRQLAERIYATFHG